MTTLESRDKLDSTLTHRLLNLTLESEREKTTPWCVLQVGCAGLFILLQGQFLQCILSCKQVWRLR
jgi:hypothetical protein